MKTGWLAITCPPLGKTPDATSASRCMSSDGGGIAMAVAVVEVAEELAPLQDKDLKVTVERMLLQSSERKRKGSI